jgi:hypothetical protein
MRAREFVMNVPITIKIEEPEMSAGKVEKKETSTDPVRNQVVNRLQVLDNNNLPPKDPSELDPDPVMVPPLQQQIEINKAAVGKTSPVIDELTQDEEDPEDEATT